MSIIKRKREEYITENNIVVLESKYYFLGIPVYQDTCYSTSIAATSQFTMSNEQPVTGLYDVNNIGFKQECSNNS